MMGLNEWGLSEKPAIETFQGMGYGYRPGEEISPHGDDPEREAYSDVVLRDRLKEKLREFNPSIPDPTLDEALSQLLGFTLPRMIKNNKDFHHKLVEGIPVEYEKDGEQVGDRVKVVDFENPERNDFLISNQFLIQIGDNPSRKPDIIVFLNGLPIGIIENKDPTNPKATVKSAYKQVTERYKRDIPDLFHYNEFIAVMDESNARVGCLGANWEWFLPWEYIESEGDTHSELPPAEVLIRGLFDKERLLEIIQDFIVFAEEEGKLKKKLATFYQYYGVKNAVEKTIKTVPDERENRIGIFYHTQRSGKTLSMVFYTKMIRKILKMHNPTIVVVTDRTDLDSQAHDEFRNAGLKPEQADSIRDLREKLDRRAGGIIFTTIQKFQTEKDEVEFPEINDRQNVVVIADEAHRSQYKKLAANLRRALPNASFIGFTATPIELEDRSTRLTFGDYISQFPLDHAERVGSTVPIYYESRLAKLKLRDERIDKHFNELMKSKSDDLKREMTEKWTSLRRIIENSEDRLKLIAEDIVQHYNNRELEGKAIVVAISRRAAVKYKQYIEKVEDAPEVEVVITNPEEFIDEPKRERDIKSRFKDPSDPLKIVVVCEKWITGFNVPPLHTMYIDKPMKNHTLLQAVARVKSVYKDKPGGLIVDYIGIADDLKRSLDRYTSDLQERAMLNLDLAIEIMKEKHQKVASFFKETDYKIWRDKKGLELQRLFRRAENEVLESEERKKEFMDAVTELDKAFTLVSPHEEANKIRPDVLFFRGVKNSIRSVEPGEEEPTGELDTVMKELISEGVTVDDIVEVSGLDKWRDRQPILSDEFMGDIEKVEQENLQVKMLEKLLRNEISSRRRRNIAQYESFKEKLEETINKYNNRFLTTQEVIDELRALTKEIEEAEDRQEKLNLSEEELAFYDALVTYGHKDLDEEELRRIAIELKDRLKGRADIDWTNRSRMRAEMKSEAKKVLRSKSFTHKDYESLIDPIVAQAEAFYGGMLALNP